jgi:hypothetical protein
MVGIRRFEEHIQSLFISNLGMYRALDRIPVVNGSEAGIPWVGWCPPNRT